ncbi:hypothetical protein [Spirosoma oryzicola]|uniref:hypothetical protein n=1 Tax=Spirosoma oryzicola TaxID=2898794 RepID=UPI001E5501D9|nr:hypothetical protein [Spirosoma oryzicola]UHG93971.1 hypothetical protein LQ777_24710 [Spirosoma oryzicola]
MAKLPLTDSDGVISKKEYNDAKKSCQKTLDALTVDIKQIQIDIAAVIANDSYLKEMHGYLQLIKAIGPVIATESEFLIITAWAASQ